MRTLLFISLPAALFSLSACDAATEMAGDAIKDQIRTEFISRCEQIAEDNGITAQNVGPACGCAADNLAADASDGSLEINQEKVEELLRTCISSSANAAESAPADTPPAAE